MARTIRDCAAILNALAEDGPEPTALMPPPAPLDRLPTEPTPGPKPLQGLTIAITDRPTELESNPARGYELAHEACERLGGRVLERDAPQALSFDDLTTVLLTEAWGYHRRHGGKRELYRPAIGEFVDASRNFTHSVPYMETQAKRAAATKAWEDWFAQHEIDLVLEPTLSVGPPDRGPGYEPGHAGGAGDPLIALTVLWDMTGFPVATLPVPEAVPSGRVPAGVSLIAPRGHEHKVTQAGVDLQTHALGLPEWPTI
jgi:aspartyl-tRNA(Asn)/glutamyl-tRNA(Gln) amidotransferase subunit A